MGFKEMVERMLEGIDLQLEKDYSNFEVEMIFFSAADLHQATRNLLRLGKRAGERSAQREFKADIKEYELRIRSDESEISRLKRENRKLQRELKKLGETTC